MHCSVMGHDALEKAIANYRGAPEEGRWEIVCECFGVTDQEIGRAVVENRLGPSRMSRSMSKPGAGAAIVTIGSRRSSIEFSGNQRREKKTAALTNIQKIKLIEDTLEREIKPALQKDGGDIELVDVEGNHVMVRLCGTCSAARFAGHAQGLRREQAAGTRHA